MGFILKLLFTAIAAAITAFVLPGVRLDGAVSALLLALVLAFLNAIVRPILVLLTIPVTIFTLGLFLLVINAFIILLADYLLDGFQVNGFIWALIFSLILSVVTGVIDLIRGY